MEYVPAILTVAVLYGSLAPSVHPLPPSSTGSATREPSPPESHTTTDESSGSTERSLQNTEDEENSGAAHDSTTGRGEESAATTQNSTTICGVGIAAVVDDPIQRCLEECYYNRVPQDIRSLHEAVWPRSIHPGFALGLWLETYHQIEYCRENHNMSCEESKQIMNDITIKLTSATEIILGHRVQFNETHYPRYFVSGYNTSSTPKYLVYDKTSGCQITDDFES